MVEMIDVGIDNSLAFTLTGKITKNDMSMLLSKAKEKIEEHGSIVMLQKIESFEGIEFSAMMAECKYLYQVGISNIKKVAILTDKKWIKVVTQLEGKIFSKIDINCFSLQEENEAIDFLKSKQSSK